MVFFLDCGRAERPRQPFVALAEAAYSDMDCGCAVRNERSYRFRRTRWHPPIAERSNAAAW